MEDTLSVIAPIQEIGFTYGEAVAVADSTMTSMDSQVPLGRLHWRPVQLSFRDCWDCKRRLLTQLIPLLLNNQIVLSWWIHHLNVLEGVPSAIYE